MTTASVTQSYLNGARRPSLSDQITRLDRMLDGLSEGLNEAVADAVKVSVGDAIRQAVQSVLTEVLTNPDIVAKLRPPVPAVENIAPAVPERISIWQKLRACLAGVRAACTRRVQRVQTSIAHTVDRLNLRLSFLWTCCQLLSPFKSQLLTALAVGVVVGAAVWLAGAWLGVIGSAIGGFVTTLAVQVSLWMRQTFVSESDQLA